MADLFLGIDIGTTGIKTVLVNPRDGEMVALAMQEIQPLYPRAGWVEQDPETWLLGVVKLVRRVMCIASAAPSVVKGISLSGQMHSVVVLDRTGRVLRPAILWLDQRGASQVRMLQQRLGREQLSEWTGNPVFAGLALPSLLWLKSGEPDLWKRVEMALQPKDYVRFRLTGRLATDYGDASASGMLNVKERHWCEPLLDALAIPRRILPPIMESTHLAGSLLPQMANLLGLLSGTPVVCGTGDQQAQALGNGVVDPGMVSSTIGTGGQIFAVAPDYAPDPALRLHTFCHAAPKRWHWMAATLSAGLSFRWLRDELLGGRMSFHEMADAASAVEPGAEGLLFLPYLTGERTPHMNPHLRGAFFGLSTRHTWRHLARAVMEGVVLSLSTGLDLIRSLGEVASVTASGGATRHSLWLQLQADIFNLPVQKTATAEAAALGAAILAAVGSGYFSDIETACQHLVGPKESAFQPQPAQVEVYQKIRALFGEIDRELASVYPGSR